MENLKDKKRNVAYAVTISGQTKRYSLHCMILNLGLIPFPCFLFGFAHRPAAFVVGPTLFITKLVPERFPKSIPHTTDWPRRCSSVTHVRAGPTNTENSLPSIWAVHHPAPHDLPGWPPPSELMCVKLDTCKLQLETQLSVVRQSARVRPKMSSKQFIS